MDDRDRQAIETLFERLGEVERRAPPRDPEAEALIARGVRALPGAAYHMAQTIVVQEAALTAAQSRIEALESEAERRGSGGFFGGLFGEDGPRGRAPARAPAAPAGGGFLAGAAQTAMGVAGGVLLAEALTGMLGGAAEAEEVDEGFDAPDDDMDF
jgi:hypothetical protein